MKQIKVGNAFACEYVALGSNNKHTLVNVYTGDILVREFPANIPLAFYIEIVPDPEMSQLLKIQVLQNKKLKGELVGEFEFEPDKVALAIIPQLPFTIAKDTTVRVVAQCEGGRSTTLIAKKIKVGPVQTAG
jgi:hypothetical protein